MLRQHGLGLIFFLASCFVLLEWLHQFPVLSGKAFVSDHLARADDWITDFDFGRRLRSGGFEVNGLYTERDVRSRGIRIPKILHQVRTYICAVAAMNRDRGSAHPTCDGFQNFADIS